MERAIFQVKYDNKMYNKFILVARQKENEEIVYRAKELIANKDITIKYYNKLFMERDFDGMMSKIDFGKIVEIIKNSTILDYIDNKFIGIEEFF